VFMLLIILPLFIVALFLVVTFALLIFVLLRAPLAQQYGINDIPYALEIIMTLMLGTLNPPMGLQSFIASDIAEINILEIDVWYFTAAILIIILVVAFIPGVVTFLPRLLM